MRLGAYNVYHETTKDQTVSDFRKICSIVDVVGTSETRWKARDFIPYFKTIGWEWWQGDNPTDTGIGWDDAKYEAVEKDSEKTAYTLWGHKHMGQAFPHIRFRRRKNDKEFWVVAAHTNVHGYKGGPEGVQMRQQFADLRALVKRLLATGLPVFVVGDLNNPHAMDDNPVPAGAKYIKVGLDYLIWNGPAELLEEGHLDGQGFDHKGKGEVNSDHPFIWGRWRLPRARRGVNPSSQ